MDEGNDKSIYRAKSIMIYKVYPFLNDFENLSRLKVESSDYANTFDYSDIVVNKPWGYEYLWFQNEFVAIWFLSINSHQKTSMHCHAKKRTSLVVLDGTIACSTIDNKYQMNSLESVVLEPCVFHSSQSVSDNGTILLEIETPPMKGDLVRMHDAYGRQKTAYEKANEYSKDLSQYDFIPLTEKNKNDWKYKSTQIIYSNDLSIISNKTQLIIPITGGITLSDNSTIDIGEAKGIEAFEELKKLKNNSTVVLIFNNI